MPVREPESSKDPRRPETAQAVASVEQFVPSREPESSKAFGDCTSCSTGGSLCLQEVTRSSKDPRRLKTAQAVASVAKFVPARELESSKSPRRTKSAQATTPVAWVACPDNAGRVKARGVRKLHKL